MALIADFQLFDEQTRDEILIITYYIAASYRYCSTTLLFRHRTRAENTSVLYNIYIGYNTYVRASVICMARVIFPGRTFARLGIIVQTLYCYYMSHSLCLYV